MPKIFISKNSFASASSISFTSGIDATYKAYEFYITGLFGDGWSPNFQFQVNAVGNSGFAETIYSDYWRARYWLSGTNYGTNLAVDSTYEQSGGTNYQTLAEKLMYHAPFTLRSHTCGIFTLYNPASTTSAKNFTSRFSVHRQDTNPGAVYDVFTSGSIATTSAIDEIDFKLSSGNLSNAVRIAMYGVS